jgi:hypothetical protein
MHDRDETIKIFTLEAEHEYLIPLIKETFQGEHIELQIRSHYDTAYDGVFVGQKGIADLYVFKKDKEKAALLLSDLIKLDIKK